MSQHVLTKTQRDITRHIQNRLMELHAVAQKEDLVIADDLLCAIENAQGHLIDTKPESGDPPRELELTLSGHAESLTDLKKMVSSLSRSLADINALQYDETGATETLKFTCFDTGYHGQFSIALAAPAVNSKPQEPEFHKANIIALNNRVGHFMDDAPEIFDEFRAGHLGDTP